MNSDHIIFSINIERALLGIVQFYYLLHEICLRDGCFEREYCNSLCFNRLCHAKKYLRVKLKIMKQKGDNMVMKHSQQTHYFFP